MLSDATGQEPVILDAGRVVAQASSVAVNQDTLFSMSAAFGAAVRNL
jgi:type IV pilus assembly protein PilM